MMYPNVFRVSRRAGVVVACVWVLVMVGAHGAGRPHDPRESAEELGTDLRRAVMQPKAHRSQVNAALRRVVAYAEELARTDWTPYEWSAACQMIGEWRGFPWEDQPHIDRDVLRRFHVAASRLHYQGGDLPAAVAWLQAASLPRDRGEAARARKELQDLARLQESLREVRKVYERGDKEGAIARVKRIVDLNPKEPYPLSWLGTLYREAGRVDECAKVRRQEAAIFRGTHYGATALCSLARLRLQQGRPEQALALYEELLRTYGDRYDRGWARYERAQAYIALGRREEALADLGAARGALKYLLPVARQETHAKMVGESEAKARALKPRPAGS